MRAACRGAKSVPTAIALCWLPMLLLTAMSWATDLSSGPSDKAVELAVTGALKSKGVKEPKVISYIDLTKEFGTTSAWALAVVQDSVPANAEWEGHGPLYICLLKNRSPDCLDIPGAEVPTEKPYSGELFVLIDARIVQASSGDVSPRLILKTCTEPGGDGDCGIETTLYAYNKSSDRFYRVFRNATGQNRNELTRFIESGPLRGYIIVDYPTENAPYTYWVEVYRQQGVGNYTQILRYRGHTAYGDGNRLAVIDSEMPETLRQLGLWRRGDPLPVPAELPAGCRTLFIRHAEEWCN